MSTISGFVVELAFTKYALAYASSSGLSMSPSLKGVLIDVSGGTDLPLPLSFASPS